MIMRYVDLNHVREVLGDSYAKQGPLPVESY